MTKTHRECSELGQGTAYNFSQKDTVGWKSTGEVAAIRHTHVIDMDIYDHNILIADKLVSDCGQRDVNVLLLTTPAYKSYRDHLDKENYSYMINFCEKIRVRYPNVRYLNFMDDPDFIEEDFYDADHLSNIGAIKLSHILDKYIQENFNIK